VKRAIIEWNTAVAKATRSTNARAMHVGDCWSAGHLRFLLRWVQHPACARKMRDSGTHARARARAFIRPVLPRRFTQHSSNTVGGEL